MILIKNEVLETFYILLLSQKEKNNTMRKNNVLIFWNTNVILKHLHENNVKKEEIFGNDLFEFEIRPLL